MPFADLKSYLQTYYPIGEKSVCYVNYERKLILSNYSFYKMTKDMRLAGVVLLGSGGAIFAIYILSFYFLRKRSPPQYEVLWDWTLGATSRAQSE
jgi:hypothetical protein